MSDIPDKSPGRHAITLPLDCRKHLYHGQSLAVFAGLDTVLCGTIRSLRITNNSGEGVLDVLVEGDIASLPTAIRSG